MAKISKYGLEWADNTHPLQIEMYAIQHGGKWRSGGKEYGLGDSYHYEQMRRILWPHLDSHRWHELCRNEILRDNSTVTVLMGPGSSGKTHEAAWIYLCEYFCFPRETIVMVSSTDIRGLKLRVWGEIAMLWESATQKFDFLPGNMLDSKLAITTDSLDGDEDDRAIRDMRLGVVGIPTVQNGRVTGLQKWIGVKQKRVRLIADEAAMMSSSFLSAFSNLNKNESFRAIVLGNPNDPLDPLGKAAEPKDGWTEEFLETSKTRVWDTRFMNGRCVNLIGLDSPNMDFDQNLPAKYPYLISKKKIDETLSFFSKDSIEYYSQCVGSMKIGAIARRVLTRDMCRKFGAQEKVIWRGDADTTRVYFVDASYGGDRCVAGGGEFGLDINGKIVLSFWEPKIIPIKVGTGAEPEHQIAEFVRSDCEELGVPAENMGHDATGRGSLGTAIAQAWSAHTHPVESGGRPTDRPVSLDMYIIDPETKEKRLQLCSEKYDRRVSEYWYQVRFAVEASQIRDLPEEAMDELCTRKWDLVKNKISVEVKDGTPTRPGMKQRTGKSPDMGDWAAGIVEMARRKGFNIARLAGEASKSTPRDTPLHRHARDYSALIRSRELSSVKR